MKKFKKIIALGLATMVAVSAMSMTVFAEENTTVSFHEDNLMTAESISPEEFMEKTGITYEILNEEETADLLADQNRLSMLRGSTRKTITFEKGVKPDINDPNTTTVNFSKYYAEGTYKSVGESNTYSQELLYSPNFNKIGLTVTPNDSKSNSFTAYVHMKAVSSSGQTYETTLFSLNVKGSSVGTYVSNMSDYKVTMYINLANSNGTNVSRTGTINMNGYN